jgi:hypothetical protein
MESDNFICCHLREPFYKWSNVHHLLHSCLDNNNYVQTEWTKTQIEVEVNVTLNSFFNTTSNSEKEVSEENTHQQKMVSNMEQIVQ